MFWAPQSRRARAAILQEVAAAAERQLVGRHDGSPVDPVTCPLLHIAKHNGRRQTRADMSTGRGVAQPSRAREPREAGGPGRNAVKEGASGSAAAATQLADPGLGAHGVEDR